MTTDRVFTIHCPAGAPGTMTVSVDSIHPADDGRWFAWAASDSGGCHIVASTRYALLRKIKALRVK